MRIFKEVLWRANEADHGAICRPEIRGAILHVGKDADGCICVWYAFSDEPAQECEFVCIGTGHRFDSLGLMHMTTVVEPPYVWHIYRRFM